MGLEPAVKPIQVASMDDALRAGLWNTFDVAIVSTLRSGWEWEGRQSRNRPNNGLLENLWMNFFKKDVSTLPFYADSALQIVHAWFFDKGTPWNKVYDF